MLSAKADPDPGLSAKVCTGNPPVGYAMETPAAKETGPTP